MLISAPPVNVHYVIENHILHAIWFSLQFTCYTGNPPLVGSRGTTLKKAAEDGLCWNIGKVSLPPYLQNTTVSHDMIRRPDADSCAG